MAKRINGKIINRFTLFGLIFAIVIILVLGQFYTVQITKHEYYEKLAIEQQSRDIKIAPNRGTIYDKNGTAIAVSASASMVLLSPAMIKDEKTRVFIVDGLSEILGLTEAETEKLSNLSKNKNSYYIEVKRRIDEDVAQQVRDFISANKKMLSGVVSVAEDTKRYYPYGNLASTLIGFVGTDDVGLEGLEYRYNEYLCGSYGRIVSAKDAKGNTLPFEYEEYIEAEDGYDLYLTIDVTLQQILEKYLDEARTEHNVQNRIAGIILNVKTGEVLAMSTKADYDPSAPFVITDSLVLGQINERPSEERTAAYNAMLSTLRKNKIISEAYEPGSTFKIFTSAMSIEENLVSFTETFNCKGYLTVGGRQIHCNSAKGHGKQNFYAALANSCNPVFMTLSLRIGAETFYDYVTAFGLRQKTGIDLPGEGTAVHHSIANLKSDATLAVSGFGQSFKITPIQLASAVASVANGGKYMQPYVVKEIRDKEGNIILSNEPTVVRQTVSEETSAILCDMLENAVATKIKGAYIEGYRIAGKTGTSEKLESTSNLEDIVASFIGFAPANDPEILVLVVVDEPNSTVRYGSLIAAPLARAIFQECFDFLGIEPQYSDSDSAEDVVVPKLVGLTESEAITTLRKLNLNCRVLGTVEETEDSPVITAQIPAAGTTLPEGCAVITYVGETEPERLVEVPSLVGLTAAECNVLIVNANLNISVKGKDINYPDTVAKAQSHKAGTKVAPGTVITVEF